MCTNSSKRQKKNMHFDADVTSLAVLGDCIA